MSKRKKQTAFLKALVLHGDTEEQDRLQQRIIRAERDEQCAWRALWLVAVLALFSGCGICYSAVLIPHFFHNPSHVAVKFFCGLGLASLICALAFLVCWVCCRMALNHIQEECRRFIMATLEPSYPKSRLPAPAPYEEPQAKAARVVVNSDCETTLFTAPQRQTYTQLFSLRRLS